MDSFNITALKSAHQYGSSAHGFSKLNASASRANPFFAGQDAPIKTGASDAPEDTVTLSSAAQEAQPIAPVEPPEEHKGFFQSLTGTGVELALSFLLSPIIIAGGPPVLAGVAVGLPILIHQLHPKTVMNAEGQYELANKDEVLERFGHMRDKIAHYLAIPLTPARLLAPKGIKEHLSAEGIAGFIDHRAHLIYNEVEVVPKYMVDMGKHPHLLGKITETVKKLAIPFTLLLIQLLVLKKLKLAKTIGKLTTRLGPLAKITGLERTIETHMPRLLGGAVTGYTFFVTAEIFGLLVGGGHPGIRDAFHKAIGSQHKQHIQKVQSSFSPQN